MGVSIILKTLNEERRIGAAIESALDALPDTAIEVIVADSGSSDRTVEIAESYPVTIAQLVPPAKPSCGIGPQLGFQYSSHPLVCLMDGDMLLDPGFLSDAIAFLENHPRVAGVTGHVVEVNLDNLDFTRRVRRAAPENRTGRIDRMNGGGLYRRRAIDEAGHFSDRNLHGYEEFDLGVRLRAAGWELHRLDRPFVQHFGHTMNAYKLLARRWRSKYLCGIGELLRATLGKPHWRFLIRELPELRLWALVYVWWLAALALFLLMENSLAALGVNLVLAAAIVLALGAKQRSLSLGLYTLVAWFLHAAALPIGFFQKRRSPTEPIESRVIVGASR